MASLDKSYTYVKLPVGYCFDDAEEGVEALALGFHDVLVVDALVPRQRLDVRIQLVPHWL